MKPVRVNQGCSCQLKGLMTLLRPIDVGLHSNQEGEVSGRDVVTLPSNRDISEMYWTRRQSSMSWIQLQLIVTRWFTYHQQETNEG